jgi:ferredoxin
MKIIVDRELCEGNAACVKTAPSMFRLDENEALEIVVAEPATPQDEELARKAFRRCPRRALQLVE